MALEQLDYSVAIPAYGNNKLVEETVKAALSQKFPGDITWEILVNDDCNPIPFEKTLINYKNQIRIERNNENLGYAGNWRKTLEKAKGRWVHILHCDDAS